MLFLVFFRCILQLEHNNIFDFIDQCSICVFESEKKGPQVEEGEIDNADCQPANIQYFHILFYFVSFYVFSIFSSFSLFSCSFFVVAVFFCIFISYAYSVLHVSGYVCFCSLYSVVQLFSMFFFQNIFNKLIFIIVYCCINIYIMNNSNLL